MVEIELLNQDKIMKMVLRISQFHVYANDLRGIGTEPRCQEICQSIKPFVTINLVVIVTGDKAWSVLEPSACLFGVTSWLASTAKDLLGQPRLLSRE